MYLEFQLTSQVFADIVRTKLRSIPLCVDKETTFNGDPVAIDHLEVTDLTTLQRGGSYPFWVFSPLNLTSIPVPFLQVRQAIGVSMVKLSDLDANGPNPSPLLPQLNLILVFNVMLSVQSSAVNAGGALQLSYTFADIDWGILGFLPDAQKNQIKSAVAGYAIPSTTIDLSTLGKALGTTVIAKQAGIICDEGGNLVAMRVEIRAEDDSLPMWQDFFGSGPAPLLEGRDWALLVDSRVLTEQAASKVKGGIDNVSDFRVTSGPNASWAPGAPGIDITLEGEAIDACTFFVDDIDIDVDADILAAFSVPQPNTLRTHYHFDAGPSNGLEVVGCAATAAVLWPFIGLVMFDRDQLDLPKYLVGLITPPLLIFVGLVFAIETAGLSDDISKDLGGNCKKLDDENYECDDKVNLSLGPLGVHLNLENARGVATGLVLGGSVVILRDPPIGDIDSIGINPFAWQVEGHCGHEGGSFSVVNKARLFVGLTGTAVVCSARVLDDPLDEFVLSLADQTITIRPKFQASYGNLPTRYPCRVRIITNRGIRTITLAPPEPITPREADTLQTAVLRGIASCYKWERYFNRLEQIHWLPDPAPDGDVVIGIWQIVVLGLPGDNSIRVSGRSEELASALPSASGTVHLTLLTEGHDTRELALELSGPENREWKGAQVVVQQTLYARRASVPALRDLRSLALRAQSGGLALAMMSEERELEWSLRSVTSPMLTRSMAAAASGEAEALTVHDGRRVAPASSGALAAALSHLHRAPDASVVGSPRVAGVEHSLFVGSERGGALFELQALKAPRRMQTFATRPWFVGATVHGSVLARQNYRDGTVEIFKAVATATV